MFTGADVSTVTGGALKSGAKRRCTGISTDTRTLRPGELFVPIVGERLDGHAFIEKAMERGACGCLSQPGQSPDVGDRVNVVVPDTLAALGDLAADHLAKLRTRVIGITGSNGKTSTKEMLAVMLGAYGNVTANPGNFNNLIGLPLTAFEVSDANDFAVLEMGMNRPGEIARLTEIAKPSVGLITSIAAAHLEGLISLDGVMWAKGELYCGLADDAVAVVNARDPQVVRAAEGIAAKTITVGSKDVDVAVEGIRRTGVAGFSATVNVRGKRYDLRLRAMGRHDVWNAALAVGALVALGLDPGPGLKALQKQTAGLGGRLTWKFSKAGVNVIDDSYNANPASMRAALTTLAEVAGADRKIAVLGDMLELGDGAPGFHEEIGALAADLDVHTLFVAGRFAADVAAGYLEDSVVVAADAAELVSKVTAMVRPGDWVLVKGSRGMRMERVVHALLPEDHTK